MSGDLQPPAFRYHGFFETIRDVKRNRTLGTRLAAELPPGRELGNSAAVEFILDHEILLDGGPKPVTVRASKRRPLLVSSSYNRVCGRPL